MPIIVKAGGDFIPAPEGLQQAVCCDSVDMGMIDGQGAYDWLSEQQFTEDEIGAFFNEYPPT